MITKTFVEETKHIITWFVNVYGQCNDLFLLQWWGFGHPVLLKPHFGHPVMAKTLEGTHPKVCVSIPLSGAHLPKVCQF